MSVSPNSAECVLDPKLVAIHLVKHLTSSQRSGRVVTLADLVDELGVRRADLRVAVRALHEQGYLDALRMRLTLAGFALGASLDGATLRPLRARPQAAQAPLTQAA